jgi:hypothetical protein
LTNDTSLYLTRKELEGKLFPNKSDMITSSLKKFNEGYTPAIFKSKLSWFSKSVMDLDPLNIFTFTPFNVNLILTDKGHTGIWLVDNCETNNIELPGGSINFQDYDKYSDVPDLIMIESLLRQCYMSMFISGSDMYETTKYSPNRAHALCNMLIKKGFDIHSMKALPVYYSYDIPEGQSNFTLFVCAEVAVNNKEAMSYGPRDMIWLDKYNFRVSKSCKTTHEIRKFFSTDIPEDVRTTDHGRSLIQVIFNTDIF